MAGAAPVTFSAGGDDTASSIQAAVNAFRSALDTNNGDAAGPLAGGRREINWDAGGSAFTANPPIFDGFLNSRGARFTTPGTGFVQAPADTIDPSNATAFSTFSPLRLFAPTGSNVTDILFFVPGTAGSEAATVSGFGAVFTDVDRVDSTTISFFDAADDLLLSTVVPMDNVGDGGLSFLGVLFNAGELIARVRIVNGNAALGSADVGAVDVVAMDDFIYAEPQALLAPTPAPEPSTLALVALAALLLIATGRPNAIRPGGRSA
jgi:hypothetical protein